ncbi:flagellin [Sporosarcina sp. FSL K6-1540]|uniref:flagellin N-terminal helical domain-containing protein n=1 Tax=Sporosarcina sp. FSL K6-1540 TaxID=2921555 RepID=UPI00315A3173
MRINHNIAALNTHRQLNSATTQQSKSMEKLASGMRINKAGDDAAGLAISEKMRGQIRGLDQASKNSQDGISMIATAEGALNETHDILQRMRELATQSSNDTNTTSDRGEIQKEINSLTSEINRIGNTTEFNTQKLLNGGEKSAALTATATGTGGVTPTAAKEAVQGVYSFDLNTAFAADNTGITIGSETFTIGAAGANDIDTTAGSGLDSLPTQGAKLADLVNNGADKDKYLATWDNSTNTLTIQQKAGQESSTAPALTIVGTAGTISALSPDTAGVAKSDATLKVDTPFAAGDTLKVGDKTLTFGDSDDYDVNVTKNTSAADQASAIAKVLAKEPGITSAAAGGTDTINIKQAGGDGFKASFQVGANEGQSMSIQVDDMRANALGLTGGAGTLGFTKAFSVTNGTNNDSVESALDVSSHENAAKAITVINDAIEKVSAQRSNLGASQNRLEHTINNLNTSSENLTAAESRIRDVDMAKEMMEQTKNSILAQASQAMLAQANQLPQGVLQLLR